MNLEEQLDDMAVKSSEDDANLHTLQIQVNTLEEGQLLYLAISISMVFLI